MNLNSSQRKKLSKWLITLVAICILIYVGVQNVGVIARSVSWVFSIFSPLVLGLGLALIFNVPMRFFEERMWKNTNKKWLAKLRRPFAFVLSLLIILGIMTGVISLVIPELTNAVTIIVKSSIELVEKLGDIDETEASQFSGFMEAVIVNVDWDSIGKNMQSWLTDTGSAIMNSAFSTVTALVGGIVDFIIALIFSIYILFSKETLKAQVSRLIKAWVPMGVGGWISHAASVASGIFRNFVSGQTIEAIILGTLCMIGMFILGIPYAPMVGALVGVTALIPVIGAFIGAFIGGFMILTVSPIKALVFVIFLVILQQIEGNLIYPKVMGSRVHLPALWILASVTVGGAVAGPVGMLLGVPLTSTAYVLLREATEEREANKSDKKTEEQPDEDNEIE